MSDGYTFILLGAFIVGSASTLWQLRNYVRIAPTLNRLDRLIPAAFVVVSAVLTVAAGWYGWLALRRLSGEAGLEWAPVISLTMATIVLFLPLYLAIVEYLVGLTPHGNGTDDGPR